MPVSQERLQELSWPERYIFTRTALNDVNFQARDNIRLHLATYLVQNPYLSRAQIIGTLPEEGARLIVANHTNMEDVFLMHWLSIVAAGRTSKMIAKAKLVNPTIKEPEIMQERRRKKNLLKKAISALGIDSLANKYIAAPYARAFNVIPFNVGEGFSARTMSSLQKVSGELRQGGMVINLLTGSKSPPLDLLDALPLAALIASHHPDVPVARIGISYKPFIIKILDDGLTYRKVIEERAPQGIMNRRNGIAIMTRVIADDIGHLIEDPHLKPAWWLERNGFYSEEELRAKYAERENPKDIYDLYLKVQRSIRGSN